MWHKGIAGVAVMTMALAACSGGTGPASTTQSATGNTLAITSTTSSIAATTTTAPSTTTITSTATTTTSTPNRLPGWDTWTLIYASLDVATHSGEEAAAIAATIDDAAVLISDDYPSLNSGYWVVYAGEWHDRRDASAWCPRVLEPSLSCYPRYLGGRISELVVAGGAVAQLNEKLVVLDPESGEIQATLSDNFHNEGEFPGWFNLNLRESELYFGLGFEDSWYSCESDKGQVIRLDLDTGTEDVFADGWSPTISPDGRWLALVSAAECYPDPEVGGWVITPGSQVEVYDLSTDAMLPAFLFRPEIAPTSYDDERQVLAVYWDAASGGLLVALGDDTVRSVALTRGVVLDEAPVIFEMGESYLAAVSPDCYYFTSATGSESVLVTEVDRVTDEVTSMREAGGYWTGIAVNRDGEVLIGSSGQLILPSGEVVPIEGDVYNLAW